MPFNLNPDSRIPIYIQLKEAIKLAIATGKFLPGSQLPTVRQLAVQLKINANTVSRVYLELESEGVLASRQGKGTFVKERPEIDTNMKENTLNDLLDDLIIKVSALGFSSTELLKALEKKLKE
ncbi:putative transcriptional regulator [Desulfosporosinus acidiphilus SJ4]|uniref:Putative transcriptional regulator n=1 Tax=Desulfosporosinus acidiphilus (strain DSM 22704 / JCM 16185 / SJ4) TaxID=646529 RepID=I4D832_DESAJ|nr:GntR family transcriptional regulator [Desulfosporosinus acidiphilus]AFM41956.1 putative transcriptional regulator [Desulfosporosinus acidiphilus SJ4]